MNPVQALETMRSGNHGKVFRRLYSLLPSLQRWVKRQGGCADDAEDLLQESMVVFYRRCTDPAFELHVKAETYVFAVAKNLFLAAARKRVIECSTDRYGEQLMDHDGIAECLEQESRFRRMEDALRQVGDKCLELLQRFYLRKESMQHIAVELGFRNEHVAKAMKYKCLEKARQLVSTQSPIHETY